MLGCLPLGGSNVETHAAATDFIHVHSPQRSRRSAFAAETETSIRELQKLLMGVNVKQRMYDRRERECPCRYPGFGLARGSGAGTFSADSTASYCDTYLNVVVVVLRVHIGAHRHGGALGGLSTAKKHEVRSDGWHRKGWDQKARCTGFEVKARQERSGR